MEPLSDELARAQERLERRRASQGIGPRPIARPAATQAAAKHTGKRTPKPEADAIAPDPFDAPIPEGDYFASYVRFERGLVYGRAVLFVYFKIIEGPHSGRELLRFYNAARGPRLPRTSGLYRDFVAVTDRRPPSKPFKPSWAFSGAMLRAHVVTVRERVQNGARVPMADCETYSKIDALLALEGGASPALRGSREDGEGKKA